MYINKTIRLNITELLNDLHELNQDFIFDLNVGRKVELNKEDCVKIEQIINDLKYQLDID